MEGGIVIFFFPYLRLEEGNKTKSSTFRPCLTFTNEILMQQFQKAFLNYHHQQTFKQDPQNLYDPIRYIMNLGGKRMRPIMLLMSYNLFKEDYQRALPAAYAIELFHNFSLVHDDIMDCAPLRRGQPTVHKKWNENTSILAGDAMLVLVYQYLTQIPDTTILPHLLQVFNKAALGVCEGQIYDMEFETQTTVSIETYLKMIELKTSVLLAAGMEMGAMIAGATPTDATNVYEFGKNIGIAFQIQDDYLDTFGDPSKFGKKVGGDIAQNKKTFLLLKALEVADEKDRKQIAQLMALPAAEEAQKIHQMTTLLQALNIPELTAAKKNEYQERAFMHLSDINVPLDRKQALKDIAEYLLDRDI